MSQFDDYVAAAAADRALKNELKARIADAFVASGSAAGFAFTAEDAASYFDQHAIDAEKVLEGAYARTR